MTVTLGLIYLLVGGIIWMDKVDTLRSWCEEQRGRGVKASFIAQSLKLILFWPVGVIVMFNDKVTGR